MSRQVFNLPQTLESKGVVGRVRDLFRPEKHVQGFPMTPAYHGPSLEELAEIEERVMALGSTGVYRPSRRCRVSFTRDGQVVKTQTPSDRDQ